MEQARGNSASLPGTSWHKGCWTIEWMSHSSLERLPLDCMNHMWYNMIRIAFYKLIHECEARERMMVMCVWQRDCSDFNVARREMFIRWSGLWSVSSCVCVLWWTAPACVWQWRWQQEDTWYHRAAFSDTLVWAHDSPQLLYEPIFLNALRLFLNICIMSFVFIKPSQITFSFPWCLTCFFYILWPWKQFPFSFHSLHCIMIIEACELLEFNFST